MGKTKTSGEASKWTWKRYYRVDVRVKGEQLRALEPQKMAFLLSCPALIRIDFDYYEYTTRSSDTVISFKDLEKPKCIAVINAIGLEFSSARGRMW